jgi:flagellin
MGLGDFSRISTNTQAARALHSLSKTNNELGMRQYRLATGSRLNAAEDDSAAYSIAKKLESKVRGQAQALANIGDSKSMLTVAEGGLSGVMDILQTMKEKAVQAANDTLDTTERTAIGNQMTELLNEVDDIFNKTTFNGKNLFDAAAASTFDLQVGDTDDDTFQVSIDQISSADLNLTGASVTADLTLDNTWDTTTFGVPTIDTTNYTGGSQEVTFTVDSVDSANGAVTLRYGSGVNDTITVADAATFSYEGADLTLDTGDSSNLTAGTKFSVKFEKQGLDVSDSTNARTTIETIDDAINTVASQMSKLGDYQKRLSFKQENLTTSMSNYESARSRIADADFAKEQMQIVKLQILQQTGTASLAQANSSGQSVLSLMGG